MTKQPKAEVAAELDELIRICAALLDTAAELEYEPARLDLVHRLKQLWAVRRRILGGSRHE